MRFDPCDHSRGLQNALASVAMDSPAGEVMVVLVHRVLGKEPTAWTELVAFLHPHIEVIVATSRSLGPLRASEDHRRNCVTDVLAKLARNDYNALAILEHWLAANPDRDAGDWLRIVTTNVIRDYVRKQLGSSAPGPGMEDSGAKKRLLHTLASTLPPDDLAPSLRPPVTDQQTARELLEYAEHHLPHEQMRALEAWLQQADFAEVGRVAGVKEDLARGGERLVRAALARLRRQFVVETNT